MPEGRASGRRVAASIDGDEHGVMLWCVMAVGHGLSPTYTVRDEPIANCNPIGTFP
jgi:hypothetical protein